MSTLNFIKSMNNRLTVQECDFLIDLVSAVQDGKVERSAETFGANVKTVINKLSAQADLLEGIPNEMNNE